MTINARTFPTIQELVVFFNLSVADVTKIKAIYFDTSSGNHVLVWVV